MTVAARHALLSEAALGEAALGGLLLNTPVWVSLRDRGRRLAAGWHDCPTLAEALSRSCAGAGLPPPGRASGITAEICLTRDFRDIADIALPGAFSNAGRGLNGIEIRHGSRITRIAPTETIATNRSLPREIERLIPGSGKSRTAFLSALRIRSFRADQFLLELGPAPRAVRMHRGNRVVRPEEVGPELMRRTLEGLTGWMRRNLHPDGRMTYKYWPSRGMESRADNSVRQMMATVALGRIAARSGLPEDAEAARRNLAHNLARYYAVIGGVGAILLDGKAKLGASALAALALLEFRQAGLIGADAHAAEFDGLCRGVQALWQPDGAFRTFLVPEDRNDNQNFYPGEALLFWASLHRVTRDPALAARCMASFRHYRAMHLADPNPAFVPWHSQACTLLWEDLGDPELAAFVLERNDWLLGMQQWGGGLAADFQGRFHNPSRPDFGPPHASATGVYMEGLADAWRLAEALGDSRRSASYGAALRRGLRAVRQLQYVDPALDAYYIRNRSRVMGGLRTETYNNEIRVDNVQHCLMALLKIEASPRFPWA